MLENLGDSRLSELDIPTYVAGAAICINLPLRNEMKKQRAKKEEEEEEEIFFSKSRRKTIEISYCYAESHLP